MHLCTFRAPRHIQETFCNDLQVYLAAVPGFDLLMLVTSMLELVILRVMMMCGVWYWDTMDSMLQLLVRGHLDDVLSYGKIQSAIGCLKCHKAANESGILPELVMSRGPVIFDKLVLFALLWRDRCIVRDWYNALIVPIPKKGNLKLCDK